jgi:hypothetical protein
MIIDYYTVRGQFNNIDDHVNRLIKLGWQPYGFLIVYQDKLIQAMVKMKDNSPIVENLKELNEL